MFFVYEKDQLNSEYDTLEDAVIFHHPVPEVSKHNDTFLLFGQLIGMVEFSRSLADSVPAVITLENITLAVREHSHYLLISKTNKKAVSKTMSRFLGSESKNAIAGDLTNKLERFLQVTTFFQGSLQAMIKRYKAMGKDELDFIFTSYLSFAKKYDSDLHTNLPSTKCLSFTKTTSHIFLKVNELLQYCQRSKNVLCGYLTSEHRLIYSQLESKIVEQLYLLRPNQKNIPACVFDPGFQLPLGLRLVHIYLTREQYNRIANNSEYHHRTLKMFSDNKKEALDPAEHFVTFLSHASLSSQLSLESDITDVVTGVTDVMDRDQCSPLEVGTECTEQSTQDVFESQCKCKIAFFEENHVKNYETAPEKVKDNDNNSKISDSFSHEKHLPHKNEIYTCHSPKTPSTSPKDTSIIKLDISQSASKPNTRLKKSLSLNESLLERSRKLNKSNLDKSYRGHRKLRSTSNLFYQENNETWKNKPEEMNNKEVNKEEKENNIEATNTEEDMVKVHLYIQAHSNTMLMLILKPGIDLQQVKRLWEVTLPQMGDIEAEVKSITSANTTRKVTKKKDNFLYFTHSKTDYAIKTNTDDGGSGDSEQQSFLQSVSTIHQQFQMASSMQEITIENDNSCVYASRNATQELYYQPRVRQQRPPLPNMPSTWRLDRQAHSNVAKATKK